MTDEGSRKVRIGVLCTHPIQYVAPLLRFINQSDDIEAIPIYLTDFSLRGAVDEQFGRKVVWDVDLLGGTDPIFVSGYRRRQPKGYSVRDSAPSVWSVVRSANLDALVVFGHSTLANYFAIAAARSDGLPVFHVCDTQQRRATSGFSLKISFLRSFYRRLDGVLAIGTANRNYYEAMGVPPEKIFQFPFSVDNERMIAGSALSLDERAEVRASLGARTGVPLIIYASKLTTRKHPDGLLEAARNLRIAGLDFDLLFVGTGEIEAALRDRARDFPGAPPIFAGFRNQSEMPRMLGASDIFVLPAQDEPWGLIINEAMCAGLAIVTTAEVGAVPDLVIDGDNGRLFDAGDIGQLTDVLRLLVTDSEQTRRMGNRSRQIIGGWSYAEDLAGIRAALRSRAVLPPA